MSEMIERVAKAIHEAVNREATKIWPGRWIETTAWEKLEDKTLALIQARAAIEALLPVNTEIWTGITRYLQELHREGAVDEAKMAGANYYPIEELLERWGIPQLPPRALPAGQG
jgi:hypothetical protein